MKCTVTLAVLLALPALAIPPVPTFRDGDVVVTSAAPACAVDPPPPADFVTTLHKRDASTERQVSTAVITAMAYWQAQRGVFVARAVSRTEQSIDFLGSDGHFVPLTAPGLLANRIVMAMTPAGSDLLAVVYSSGVAVPELWRFKPDGTVTDRINLPEHANYIVSIDVAADGCTMAYATGTSEIGRFDLCTRQPLAQFSRQSATAVRFLPDGGLLAASGTKLLRFDATGNLIAQYVLTAGLEGIGALTLDANPSIAWVVTSYGCGFGTAHVMEVSIGTGTVVAGPAVSSRSGGGSIAVQGEWHASVNKAPVRRRTIH